MLKASVIKKECPSREQKKRSRDEFEWRPGHVPYLPPPPRPLDTPLNLDLPEDETQKPPNP